MFPVSRLCVHRKERLWWLHSIMGNTSAKVLGYQGTVTIVCWAPAVLGCIKKKKIFWSLLAAREFILQLNKQETTRKLINLRSPQSKPPPACTSSCCCAKNIRLEVQLPRLCYELPPRSRRDSSSWASKVMNEIANTLVPLYLWGICSRIPLRYQKLQMPQLPYLKRSNTRNVVPWWLQW